MRRASAVVLIHSIKRKQSLKDVFEVADSLLTDEDVMVQKGYGWMLKEASNKYPHEVFEYVIKHKRDMPRTAFRCAIEKLPAQSRRQAMK
jgi:3-methyladenine DNA glycosylase AlkD